ncbi:MULTISPECIES: hypothetical protein [unclassified Streptomyces]|uniref:hypothetical protein n=1 Tax=unclassified Streptomyces TaxID=2593676 RepID=UPI00365911AB
MSASPPAAVEGEVGTAGAQSSRRRLRGLLHHRRHRRRKALSRSASTDQALKVYRERNTGPDSKAATKRFEPSDARLQQIYMLKLCDGSTLAIVPSAHDQFYELRKEYILRAEIIPNEKVKCVDGSAWATRCRGRRLPIESHHDSNAFR